MAVKPLRAYEGKEPYIFISYAHKDSEAVFPIIRKLQDENHRVWYDAGIEAGTEWPEYIAEHIKDCACFVCFITQSALDSHNCRREINYAIKLKKNMLTAYLEDVDLSDGMEMQLDILQAIFRSRHDSDISFLDEFLRSALLKECKFIPEDTENEAEKASDEKKEPDLSEFEKLCAAAENGKVSAQLAVAKCYACGDVVPQDPAAAKYWYTKAAEQGNVEAQILLSQKYSSSFEECEKWLTMAESTGNAEAQYLFGRLLSSRYDYSHAVQMFYKAAGQGHAKAQLECGECCYFGKGVPRNREKAIEWYLEAFKNGGIKEEHVELMDTFIQAFRFNDASDQYLLGLYFLDGRIHYPSIESGISWIEKAAEQEYPKAYNWLGIYYENSKYLGEDDFYVKDETKAFEYYYKGAKLDDPFAMYNLGRCYEFGIGVKKDPSAAQQLYSAALGKDVLQARDSLQRLSKNGFIRMLLGKRKIPPVADDSVFEIKE